MTTIAADITAAINGYYSSSSSSGTKLNVSGNDDDFDRLGLANSCIVSALQSEEAVAGDDFFSRRGRLSTSSSSSGTSVSIPTISSNSTTSPTVRTSTSSILDDHGYTIVGTVDDESEVLLSPKQTIPTPPLLLSEISSKAHVSTLMGLFPSANLAWLTVDSTCYLWSYSTSSSSGSTTDFCSFTVPSNQCITSVGLAAPKVGIFKAQVLWILTIATPEEVLLCAITTASSAAADAQTTTVFGPNLRIIPTTFCLPTDGCSIYVIQSTSQGRIFLGTSNGNVLEFCYQIDLQKQIQEQLQRLREEEEEAGELSGEDEDYDTPTSSWTSTILSGSKRLLSDFLFSTSTSATSRSNRTLQDQQPRKKQCRKVNHTQPSFFATLLPNFLHSLFFISSSSRGGDGSPILDMAVIEGEQKQQQSQSYDTHTTSSTTWLHVLNANGVLYTYSLLPNTTELHFMLSTPINIPRVTQQYLEALTRPVPPNDYYSFSSTASNTSAAFHFEGGVPVALAGLGGTSVECAKRILKYCTNTAARREQGVTKGILNPLRIFCVPPYMSSRVRLIIVTQGGFRLYLSLNHKYVNNNNSTSMSKVHLQMCHIRAPPSSYTSSPSSSLSKVNPGVLHHHHNLQQQLASAVASYYDILNQTLLLGLDGYSGLLDYNNSDDVAAADDQYTGDILVACVPDLRRPTVVESPAATTRVSTAFDANSTATVLQQQYGSGSKEFVATPKVSTGFGRIWQITGVTDDCFVRTHLTGSISPSGGKSRITMSSSIGDVHLPACPSIVLLKHKKKYKVLKCPSKHKQEKFIMSPSSTDNAANQKLTSTMTTTLPLLTLQFYRFLYGKDDEILTLTTSGIHVYKVSSTLESLCRGLSSPSMSDNKITQKFLPNFGAAELCFMCLTIAIAPSSSQSLIQRATRIALANGGRPTVLLEGEEDGTQTFYDTATTITQLPQQPQQPTTFRPSALHQGFVSLLARLLRPVWFQPFLQVITPLNSKKSKQLHKRESKRWKPHHVHLLFDPNLVLFELKGLQKLMKDIFARAIESVPVSTSIRRRSLRMERAASGSTMDVDEWMFSSPPSRPNLMLAAFGGRSQQPTSSQLLFADENRNVVARFYEETSLHNLYRLLSRTTQALSLLSILLRRQKEVDDEALLTAENAPVEWGFLHNLTLHQMVCSPEATDRITALLQSMLLSSSSSPFSVTAPSNGAYYYPTEGSNTNSRIAFQNHQLAQELSSQCYLYFLQSDYMSQEAMAAIIAARDEIPGSETFRVLSHRAATLWTKASSCWRSARLVTGKLAIQHPVTASGMKEESSLLVNFPQDLESLAYSSMYSSSPLVKACVALFSISNVTGIVDVCLTCAANFGGTASGTQGDSLLETNYMLFQPQTVKATNSMPFPWEEGLYCSTTSTASRPDTAVTTIASGNMFSPHATERLGLLRSLSPVAARASAASTAATTAATSNVIGSSALVYSEVEEVASPLFARQFCCSLILHFLHLLLLGKKQQDTGGTSLNGIAHEQQTPKIAESMLSVCVASNDEYFHNMLYEFLLISDNVSTLLRLQTPFLEKWLAKVKRTAAVEDGTQLLYRYYVVHHRHDLASMVMERKSSVETEHIPLENRIEFLTRAISSTSAAVHDINGGDRSLEVMKLSELKDKLEVALLQKKILLELGGLDETGLDSEKKQALQYKLLTVSDLFNDFAAPLGLYEICLLIMSVCKTNDSSTIQDIWRRILSSVLHKVWSTREEVQRVLRAIHEDIVEEGSVEAIEFEFESGEWIRPLKEKVIYLGKQLWGKGSDYTFPLLHIIPVLEGLRQTFLDVSDGGRTQSIISLESLHWPVLSLAQAGVSYPIILDYYRMILSDKEKEGDLDGSFHYLKCISEILTQWIKASYSARAKAVDVYYGDDGKIAEMPSITSNYAAQLAQARSTGLLNLIDNYKSSLEAVVGKRSREATQLLKVFMDIEENLKAF